MNDIELSGLTVSFGEKTVICGLTHTFPGGKVTCITGPSGCGKTTLLNVIAGIIKPDGGTVSGVPERISFVFQEDRLCEEFSAVGNIRFVCGRRKSRAEILSHLEELSLGSKPDEPVSGFSGGMKRRVAIARAIMSEGDCVLLDEPFKGLDEALKRNVMDYVLRHTKGKTVICVTHDISESEYLGGELLTLSRP